MATADLPSAVEDNKESLLYVMKGDIYRGYSPDLLKEELPPYLRTFVVCSYCEGVLRGASGVGDPQVFVCLVCTQEKASIVLKHYREAVSNLTILCPLKSRGCGWEGKVCEGETHLDTCGFFRIGCHLSCGLILMRNEIAIHESKSCPLRGIQCEFCALFYKVNETNMHQVQCTDFTLKCPNACGALLKRKHMLSHTEDECENTELECPYKEYGCGLRVARKEMGVHKRENRLIHLELRTDSIEKENSLLREEVRLVKEENSLLREDFSLLREEVSLLKFLNV